MFQVNDKVVANGFRARGGSQHRWGTTSEMIQWERENVVLTVREVHEDRIRVNQHVDDIKFTYDLSEIRYATQAEINAATETAPTTTVTVVDSQIKRSALVKLKDGNVMYVIRDSIDSDGDYSGHCVSNANRRSYFKLREVESVLGYIQADGDFRPATAADAETVTVPPSDPADPATWKAGDKVQCLTSEHFYVCAGDEYEVLAPLNTIGAIMVRDKDGDPGRYPATSFVLVRRADGVDVRPTWRALNVGDIIRLSDSAANAAYTSNRGKLGRVTEIDDDPDIALHVRVQGLDVRDDWFRGDQGDFTIVEKI